MSNYKNTMNAVTAQKLGRVVLHIEGEMTLYRCVELKEALLAPLASGVALDVDLSGVTEIDTAGLQLLILAKALARQGALRLLRPSTVVLDLLQLLGLTGHFGDQIVVAAPAADCGNSSDASAGSQHGT